MHKEAGIDPGPFLPVEPVVEECHFNGRFALGMEATLAVTTEVFDLVVEAFGQVGGAQLPVEGAGVFEEGKVTGRAFLEVLGERLIVGAELFQKGAEPGLSAVGAAGGQDFAPGLLEGSVVLWAQVALGVAQQMDGTERGRKACSVHPSFLSSNCFRFFPAGTT